MWEVCINFRLHRVRKGVRKGSCVEIVYEIGLSFVGIRNDAENYA